MTAINITEEQMTAISNMARVPLPADASERAKVIEKFKSVIAFVAVIESIEVPDHIPKSSILVNNARFDDVDHSLAIKDAIVNQFPSRQGNHLVVPKVLAKKGK